MNHLEYYVVYYLDRGNKIPPVRVTTVNYLTKQKAIEKVKSLKDTEPSLAREPEIHEYRY